MQNIPFRVLIILAAAFWLSTLTMLVMGVSMAGLSVLRLAAIPDGIFAVIFTAIAVRRWSDGSK